MVADGLLDLIDDLADSVTRTWPATVDEQSDDSGNMLDG